MISPARSPTVLCSFRATATDSTSIRVRSERAERGSAKVNLFLFIFYLFRLCSVFECSSSTYSPFTCPLSHCCCLLLFSFFESHLRHLTFRTQREARARHRCESEYVATLPCALCDVYILLICDQHPDLRTLNCVSCLRFAVPRSTEKIFIINNRNQLNFIFRKQQT